MNELTRRVLANDLSDLEEVAKEMGRLSARVAEFPDNFEVTVAQLEILEDVRHQALKLARECRAVRSNG